MAGKSIRDRSMTGAILDSNQQSILLAESEFTKFKSTVQAIFANLTCTTTECYTDDTSVTCSNFTSKFPSLEIQIDRQVYSMPSSAYCLDYAVGGQFVLAVGSTLGSNYILGLTFMRAFYTEFDLQDAAVTLAVNSYAPSGTSIYKAKFNWDYFGIQWVGLVLIIAGIVLCVTLVIICRRAAKKKNARGSSIYYEIDSNKKRAMKDEFNNRLTERTVKTDSSKTSN